MSDELAVLDTWLYATLSADATMKTLIGNPARVYDALAPKTATYPLLIYQLQAGTDVRVVGGTRIMLNALYVVKAGCKDKASFADARAIAARADALLHGARGTAASGHVLGCVREEPFKLLEVIEGTEYRWLGGIYRLWAQ